MTKSTSGSPASTAIVRREMVPDMPPPIRTSGLLGWMRSHLFNSPANAILTIFSLWLIYIALSGLLNFVYFNAIWQGTSGADCRVEGAGACWPYVSNRLQFFTYGFYPDTEYWRPNLAFLIGAVLLFLLATPRIPGKLVWGFLFLVVYPFVTFLLLSGGGFTGLKEIPTVQWGGLMLTLVVAVTGIVASFPLGVVLALGRRSKMPLVRSICVVFIELWRGVPLITVLFMASVMLPLFLPEGTNFDKLVRALVGVTLFTAAYTAEVVRGGLQAIEKGQYEAADSLGLNYFQATLLIILPQALKLVIPGIVNNSISLFKDTTLVSIVGLIDLLGAVKAGTATSTWSAPTIPVTGYVFAAGIFWIFTFSMSRYSQYMEKRLDTGHKT
ncbi:L-amino acid ABC transporter (Glu/Asp/His/...), permease protein 2 AapM [hydrothermal vent metagenome]|uniref:L-amino acid ABC transporter (Glu/Asp/His/...), permease protein 2 AapM n=1 Tax=hydrothermal vent metagenome TaxID=652676 RepID=A0A3B0TVL7_9ZZZZ